MKADSLQIGTRKNGGRMCTVDCKLPETRDEINAAITSDAVLARMVQRALRIEMQERSGARDIIEEAPASDFTVVKNEKGEPQTVCKKDSATYAAVLKAVTEYDPNVESARTGRPPRVKEVTLDETALKSAMKDPSKLAALLAAQGIKLEIK